MVKNGFHVKSQTSMIQLFIAPLHANKIHHAFLSGYKKFFHENSAIGK
jgi:hypothetical protein